MSSDKVRKVYFPCILSVVVLAVGFAAHRYFDTDEGTLSDVIMGIATGIAGACWTIAYQSWKSQQN